MTYCFGVDRQLACPIKGNCYRHTQPTPPRDRLVRLPYDFDAHRCDQFVTNVPSEEFIQKSAYFLWITAGRPDGHERRFWDEAKRKAEEAMGRRTDA